ncbi:MAG: glycosyltransferase family 4 protein, partial [Thermoplasmata archaeon]
LFVIIDSAFPYQSGGRETWLAEIVNRLCGDFSVSVVAMMNYTSRSEPFHHIPGNVKIHRVPSLFNLRVGGRFATLKYLLGGFLVFTLISSVVLLLRYPFPRVPTYVVSMSPGHSFLPTLFVRGRKVMRIACVRGPYVEEMSWVFPRFEKAFKDLQAFSYNKVDLIVANGEDTRSVVSREISNKRKVVTLPNGVNYDKFSKAFKDRTSCVKVIGMICSLSYDRGTDAVLLAARVLERITDISFRIELVGKGNVDKYRKRAAELGVDDVVTFWGERTDVDEILANMDIALALSHGGSGISHSLLEEMAAGKAIIALNIPAYKQVLKDGVTGLLVPDGEPEALANAMERLIKDDDLASKLGKSAHKEAAKYDWSVVERRFRFILHKLFTDKIE